MLDERDDPPFLTTIRGLEFLHMSWVGRPYNDENVKPDTNEHELYPDVHIYIHKHTYVITDVYMSINAPRVGSYKKLHVKVST